MGMREGFTKGEVDIELVVKVDLAASCSTLVDLFWEKGKMAYSNR